MEIRQTKLEELDAVMALYADARRFMVDTGNPRQWAARNWPPRALIQRDIERGRSHVCVDGSEILAVFYYEYGHDIDSTYRIIENGAWAGDDTYGVVHRIAARQGRGAGKSCIRWAYEQCGHLRIDTHGDNKVMQKVLERLDFRYCGIIHVAEDTDPRLAYEKL